MFLQLLLLFILVPLTDLVILMMIARFVSVWVAFGVVIAAGVLGVWLARRQWRRLGSRVQEQVEQNQIPSDLASDTFVTLLASGLLIIPGLLTDIIGLSLLIPRCRLWYRQRFLNWLRSRFEIRVFNTPQAEGQKWGNVVDGEFRNVDIDDPATDSTPRLNS